VLQFNDTGAGIVGSVAFLFHFRLGFVDFFGTTALRVFRWNFIHHNVIIVPKN
jgi:hypothetical protein